MLRQCQDIFRIVYLLAYEEVNLTKMNKTTSIKNNKDSELNIILYTININ